MSSPANPPTARVASTWRRLGDASAAFLDRLPALLVAMLCLRVGEVIAGSQTGAATGSVARVLVWAVLADAVNLLRYLALLFLLSLPFLLVRSRRAGFIGLGLFWTIVLLVQAALVQYSLTARVPLGSDLFGYSSADLLATVQGGAGFNDWLLGGLLVGLASLWQLLVWRRRWPPEASRSTAVVFAASLLVLALVPARSAFVPERNEDIRILKLSKLAYFIDDSAGYLLAPARAAPPVAAAVPPPPGPVPEATPVDGQPDGSNGFHYLDPRYPFLHSEQTPDVLGPHFNIRRGSPPNLVLIVVEGLGRSFSGPDTSLGSFTPELDKIAKQSLYFENFLAVQGRTFAVLASLLASAPFGDNGLARLGESMPAHDSLLSVLKSQGYWLKFYSGYDSDFDNESTFLKRQGVDALVDRFNFGGPYKADNSWGYGDAQLVSRTLAAEAASPRQPFATLLKTMTMHTPYTFSGQANYASPFERRLVELGIPEGDKERYRTHRDIYTAILYTDHELGRYLEGARRNPGYDNTVFVILGDHRLPELPMSTRIERYHVPLIIFSPMLKAPMRIKSVSSHFDVTPSLLAFLSKNYGLKTPKAVTWLGSGLDMEPGFRNVHSFPLKQTKTNLVDFVSGEWFINQDQLYALGDRMEIEPNYNGHLLALVQTQFDAYRAANDRLAHDLVLLPPGSRGQLGDYTDNERKQFPSRPTGQAVLSVADVRAPRQGSLPLQIEAVFNNSGAATSESFVPIAILARADGSEVSETYGPAQRLLPGQRVSVPMLVKADGAPAGRYFLTVIPSHPNTGKRLGKGRDHIPLRIDP